MTSAGSLPELARAFIRALADTDLDTVLRVADPELRLTIATAPPGVPREVRGHAQLTALAAAVERTWTEVRLQDVDAHAYADDPDRGVTRFRVCATNRDGSAYRNDYVALSRVGDGRIVEWTEYYDPAPMVVALDALRRHGRPG